MHVGYGVLDHGLCMMECTCALPHHIYSYWHFNTQVHTAMWVKDIPTRSHELLHGVVGAIQLRVDMQSTIGAHQEK